jgi:hypothetical protein
LPTVEATAPEFVEPRVYVDPVFVESPTGGIDPVPESLEEQAPEANVDGSVGEIPEELLVTIFEGQGETGIIDNGEEVGFEGQGVPFDLESGFEICVLPVPEEFAAEFEPSELLARYEEFLGENPDWLSGLAENQGDWFHEQVVTGSACVDNLEFPTPGEANAFDYWYVTRVVGNALPDVDAQDGNVESDPAEDSQPFDPRELLPRYDAFLAENPTWIDVNQGGDIQLQVITPSGFFPELEFGTPGEATAFDNWYTSWYAAQHNADGSPASVEDSGTLLVTGQPVDLPTEIHLPGESSGDGELSWLDRGAINGDIQPHWRSGSDAPEAVYSLSSSGSGLVVVGGTVANGGEVVTATEGPADKGVAETGVGNLSNPGLSLDGRAGGFPGQTPATGGEVATAGAGAFNPDLDAEAAETGDLPAEIAVPDASSAFGNVSAGLAPTSGQALIVEFGVLSPSQSVTEQVQGEQTLPAVVDRADVLPHSAALSATEATVAKLLSNSAITATSATSDFVAHTEMANSGDGSVDAADAVHGPATVAAGAIAAGGVAHGSGAAAAAARKPLPQI